jgi:hypothetical protein
MQELTLEEYKAVERFADNVKGCLRARKEGVNEVVSRTLQDAIEVINIHLLLDELKFKNYSNNQAKVMR